MTTGKIRRTMNSRIILNATVGKEAAMHNQIASPVATEDGATYVIECEQCGFLGLVEPTAVTQAMYDHALEAV